MSNLAQRLWSRHTRAMRERSRGQSMVELALVLPVLLILLLVAIDFGRVYLGYINLQQMTRVAANFAAENASAWGTPQDTAILNQYQEMVENDAEAINCTLDRNAGGELPGPAFIDLNFALGSRVEVRLGCQFGILTPIISSVVGNSVQLSASIVYPIREGAVAEVPGGGAPILVAPVADFFGTPQSGYAPLDVVFSDMSENDRNSWLWNFGNGTASTAGPHTRTYVCDSSFLPGQSCTFNVSLQVGGSGGFDTEAKSDYITVTVPPETGPIAEFEGNPVAGLEPLVVDFDFVDIRAAQGTPVTYTNFQWDFDNDGTFDAEGATATSVNHTYATEGIYNVRLRVTDASGFQELAKTAYINVTHQVCVVPDFARIKKNSAQARWADAGFTTIVNFMPGNGNYTIHSQSLLGGLPDPEPNGCNSTITVGP